MAEKQQIIERGPPHHVSAKTVVLSSLGGMVMGGPLLGMMGFSFLATLTLLLVAFPLLIIFSPVLFGAVFVLAFALAGFGTAAAMAFAGMSTFMWVFRSFRKRMGGAYVTGRSPYVTDKLIESGDVTDKLMESGEAVKEHGEEGAGDLQQNPQENLVNRPDEI